jgi:hypothetical protein
MEVASVDTWRFRYLDIYVGIRTLNRNSSSMFERNMFLYQVRKRWATCRFLITNGVRGTFDTTEDRT